MDQEEKQRLVYVAEGELRIAKMRVSGELDKQLKTIQHDFCFHCWAWHAVCTVNGCNSCAGGCHFNQSRSNHTCRAFWDTLNSPEYSEMYKTWRREPSIDALVHYLRKTNGKLIEHGFETTIGHIASAIKMYNLNATISFVGESYRVYLIPQDIEPKALELKASSWNSCFPANRLIYDVPNANGQLVTVYP